MVEITKLKQLHFIGIGGCGMSAIARVLIEMGYKVSGSDLKENANTLRLKDLGAKVYFRHDESNVVGADVIVVSTAIPSDNPEYMKATEERIPMLKRAEMLEFLMQHFQQRIAVAGTHGKTTTSSMVARFLDFCDVRPTYVIGGEMMDYGGNAALGAMDYFVAEADESDGSFLLLSPNVGIITNIEPEHMEHYQTAENLFAAFRGFIDGVLSRDGHLVVNQDDPELMSLMSDVPTDKYVSFGIDREASVMATDLRHTEEGVRFNLLYDGRECGDVLLQVFGKHNVYNALAVIAYGLTSGFTPDQLKKGLSNFRGTKRRFQQIGHVGGIQIYDDYGHHPTEIRSTLSGIKLSMKGRLICIFQPHRYSRTRDLLEGFPSAFQDADMVVITEIYSANEKKIEGMSGSLIVDRMDDETKDKSHFIAKKSDVIPMLQPLLKEGDIVITMGAGDIHSVAKELLHQLQRQHKSAEEEVPHQGD